MPEISYATQYQSLVDVPPGQEVLLMSTAVSGPIGIPILCQGSDQAESIFGTCELTRAFREAYAAGGRYLYLLRLEGPLSPDSAVYDSLLVNYLPALLELPFVIFHPVGFYFDRSQVLDDLLDFAVNRANLGLETLFVLGTTPAPDDQPDVANLLAVSSNYGFFPRVGVAGVTHYLGRHFSVVVSQSYYASNNTVYQANASSTYAGLLSSLPPAVNPTNKNTGLYNAYPEAEYEALAQAGYVVLAPTVRRGVAVYRAVTMAPPDSDFSEVVIYRITAAVLARVRAVGSRYLGKPQNVNLDGRTLRRAVQAELDASVKDGLLRSYNFDLTYQPLAYQVVVDLTLRPVFSVKEVRVQTTIFVA